MHQIIRWTQKVEEILMNAWRVDLYLEMGKSQLVKDHMVWGDNYHGSNILSGHQPSFTMLKLHLQPVRWFDFNYIHGWFVSDVVDSSRSYVNGQSLRKVYRQKYIAANMFIYPGRKFQFSIGNSIIYSDQDVQPAYLVPFSFYKTVDHAQTSTGSNFLGQNSQLFFNISSRNLKMFICMPVFLWMKLR